MDWQLVIQNPYFCLPHLASRSSTPSPSFSSRSISFALWLFDLAIQFHWCTTSRYFEAAQSRPCFLSLGSQYCRVASANLSLSCSVQSLDPLSPWLTFLDFFLCHCQICRKYHTATGKWHCNTVEQVLEWKRYLICSILADRGCPESPCSTHSWNWQVADGFAISWTSPLVGDSRSCWRWQAWSNPCPADNVLWVPYEFVGRWACIFLYACSFGIWHSICSSDYDQ